MRCSGLLSVLVCLVSAGCAQAPPDPLATAIADLLDPLNQIIGGAIGRLNPLASALTVALQQLNPGNGTAAQVSSDVVTGLRLLAGALVNLPGATPPPIDPDVVARSVGLNATVYNFTSNGYKMGLYRLQNPNCTCTKGVVMLPSGVLGNQGYFIMRKEDSLGYRLAAQCYDVFLAGLTGGIYYREHETLSVNSNAYWNFTFDQWGDDVAVQLQIITNLTNSKCIYYMGVDIAGTSYAVMADRYPEDLQKLIKRTYLISPIMFLCHIRSTFFAALGLLQNALPVTGGYTLHGELIFWDPTAHKALYNLCTYFPTLCSVFFQFLAGSSTEIDETVFPFIFRYMLDSASLKIFEQFFQLFGPNAADECRFTKYNYGPEGNLQVYGSSEAPSYNISKQIVPQNYYVMLNDIVTVPRDVNASFAALNPAIQQRYVDVPEYCGVSALTYRTSTLFDIMIKNLNEDVAKDNCTGCNT